MYSGSKPLLVAIGGPTASGKSDLAVALASHFNTSIVSADSRQIYREMNIGTAKPDKSMLEMVPHYFIDYLSIQQPYSAGIYEKEALSVLKAIYTGKKIAFIVGGTGFYLSAVLNGIPKIPKIPLPVKKQVHLIYKTEHLEGIRSRVRGADPTFADEADPKNPVRWIRALEVIIATGKPFSSFKDPNPAERPFRTVRLCVDIPRPNLHQRINKRVDQMFSDGLVDEVRGLIKYRDLPALQTVGYKEVFEFLDGNLDYDACVEKVKTNTRRYAKRQITWFRNKSNWKWMPPDKDLWVKEIKNNL